MKATTILAHLAGILFFLSIPLVFSPDSHFGERTQREIFGYLLMIGFFYLNYLTLIPTLYFKKKYFWFVGVVLAGYAIITFLPQFVFPFPDRFGGPPGPTPSPRRAEAFNPNLVLHLSHTIFSFLLVVFVSLAMRINRKLKETEREQVQTELSLLKAQINPHFLFNTLNSIYSLALDRSENTAGAIVKLSGMMRYVLHDAKQDFVSLQRELQCIGDYIDLQKIRWGELVKIQYEVTGDPIGKKIAPVILQPFIENAFKHGVSTEIHTSIIINITIKDQRLKLRVVNDKVHPVQSYENQSGLGIENTRQRLELVYPSIHTLYIHDQENTFGVDLTLELKS